MNFTTFASLYGATAQSGTGCSAVGSAPGLGPGGRPFESGHPDNKAKGRSKRNLQKGLAKRNKRCTFAAQLRNGALDEWLSQRSAKPSTAVRIRQAPHKSNQQCWLLFCYSITSTFLHVSLQHVFSIRLSAALRHIKILFHIVSIVVSPQPKAQTYRPPTPQQLRTPTPS